MSRGRSVALVGLPGTGKSTAAPLLADALGISMVDLDERIEAGAGRSVAEIFGDEGESGFRIRELAALRDALSGAPVVLATGGGVLTTTEARVLLAGETVVVWLRANVETLRERLSGDAVQRPLLAGNDPLGALEALGEGRDPLYRQLADVVVDVDGRTPREVTDSVLCAMRGAAAGDAGDRTRG